MSSGAQLEMEWSAAGSLPEGDGGGQATAAGAQLSDEEILGMETVGQASACPDEAAEDLLLDRLKPVPPKPAPRTEAGPTPSEGDELRAYREMFPGGAAEALALRQAAREVESLRQTAQEVESLREAAREVETLRQSVREMQGASQAVEQIDAAIFSGDARAQSEVVTELARANPAAFRSLFAEAARVMASLGGVAQDSSGANLGLAREVSEGNFNTNPAQAEASATGAHAARLPAEIASVTSHPPSPESGYGGQASHGSFDPAAYAAFERSTNDAVARDVRGAISDALGRVLPEGIAEGAARRIGEDIFNDIHRAMAADRALSEQVSAVLRSRRFGADEQQRVATLLAGRARQLVPSVSRKVIGEWTSSVLGASRGKAARQAAAAARVDIAAPGGSPDSMPLRPVAAREVNYASMSDDDILGLR